MSNKRAAIIELHHVGRTNSAIVKLLKAPRSTVSTQLADSRSFKAKMIVLEVEDQNFLGRHRS